MEALCSSETSATIYFAKLRSEESPLQALYCYYYYYYYYYYY
jgi:hypothetical protein